VRNVPSGMYKSRTLRRVHKRTPSGKLVLHYKKRKPSRSLCAVCKKPLSGMPRERPCNLKKLPKSSRRPERMYGGYTCSSCSKKQIIVNTRAAEQQ